MSDQGSEAHLGSVRRYALAAASLGAGLIHVTAVLDHTEHAVIAAFFVVLAVVQVAWAAAMVRRPNARLLRAGAVISAGVVVIWLLSRTTGLAGVPGAQAPEAFGLKDGIASLLEVALVAGIAAHFVARAQGLRLASSPLASARACRWSASSRPPGWRRPGTVITVARLTTIPRQRRPTMVTATRMATPTRPTGRATPAIRTRLLPPVSPRRPMLMAPVRATSTPTGTSITRRASLWPPGRATTTTTRRGMCTTRPTITLRVTATTACTSTVELVTPMRRVGRPSPATTMDLNWPAGPGTTTRPRPVPAMATTTAAAATNTTAAVPTTAVANTIMVPEIPATPRPAPVRSRRTRS